MKKEKVIVFGGLGFLGSAFTNILPDTLEYVIVDVKPKPIDSIGHFEYIQCSDFNDELLLNHLVKASYVIDFAFTTNPGNSINNPINDTNNLLRCISLFSLLNNYENLKKVIVISSGGTVYGKNNSQKISEMAETNPISPYGITKLAIEKYAVMHHHLYGLPVVIIRPSNPYGPGQIPYTGHGFITTAVAKMLAGEEITVFGERGRIRDYIYIEDLVNAIYNLMIQGEEGQVYNVGTGVGRTNLDVLNQISEILEADFRIIFSEARGFDVPSNILDTNKIKSRVNWNCHTSFDDGIRKTIQWVKNYMEEFSEH